MSDMPPESERGILWERESTIALERIKERAREPIYPPPKIRRGIVPIPVIEAYKRSEMNVFNAICADRGTGWAPYAYVDVTNGDGATIGAQSARAAAWAGLYLYELIAENRRPPAWLSRARTKLGELADFLLTQQCGSPTQATDISTAIGSTATTDLEYGGFYETNEGAGASLLGSVYSETVAIGGLVLLRAYQLLGVGAHKDGYQAAMTCLRRMQCGGKLTNNHSSLDSAGSGRWNSGMWTHRMVFQEAVAGANYLALSHADYEAGTGSEFVVHEFYASCDLFAETTITPNLSGDFTYQAPGATCRIREGGTSMTADGTVRATLTSTTSGPATVAGASFANPAALTLYKLTLDGDVNQAVSGLSMVLEFS